MAKDATKVYSVDEVTLTLRKSNPPVLVIQAKGQVSTSGWGLATLVPHVYVAPPADGIYAFDFVELDLNVLPRGRAGSSTLAGAGRPRRGGRARGLRRTGRRKGSPSDFIHDCSVRSLGCRS